MLVIEQQREQREHKAIVHLRCEDLMLVGTKLGFFPNINLFERLDSERCHSESAIERIYANSHPIQSIQQCCTMRSPIKRCIRFAPSPRDMVMSAAQNETKKKSLR